ncbi:MAG: carboxypeptidase-like regulatory domain-containing protein, partial [Candidatus Acidiferrales bacterium]
GRFAQLDFGTRSLNMKKFWSGVLLVVLAGAILAPSVRSQESEKDAKAREAKLRTIRGSVIDRDENPVPESIVYLKNLRSQSVKTYIADSSAQYRFSGLDPNADYELHAEKGDVSSAVRTISNFDNRKDMELTLKLDKKKDKN